MFSSFFSTILLGSALSQYCYDQNECAGDTLTSTAYCYGYDACNSADIDTSYVYCAGRDGCQSATITDATRAYCDGEFGCYGATITDPSYLYCDGNYGCYGADITEASYVYCDSEYSCYNSDIETFDLTCDGDYACGFATVDVDDDLVCDGDLGCRSIEANVDDDLYCDGSYSCYGGDFTLDADSSSLISVDSQYSGGYADFDYADSSTGTQYYYSYGYLGSYYANVYSGEDNTLRVYLRGAYSAFRADFYCESGSTCYFYCYGYACYYTTISCDSDATCSVTCYNEPSTSFCPSATTTSLSKLFLDNKKEYKKKMKSEKLKNEEGNKIEFNNLMKEMNHENVHIEEEHTNYMAAKEGKLKIKERKAKNNKHSEMKNRKNKNKNKIVSSANILSTSKYFNYFSSSILSSLLIFVFGMVAGISVLVCYNKGKESKLYQPL